MALEHYNHIKVQGTCKIHRGVLVSAGTELIFLSVATVFWI